MPTPLTLETAKESLASHVAAKGAELRSKYGPHIGWSQLQDILLDRGFVRYPCALAFDADPLLPGECAFPLPLGGRPEDGFRLCVHPFFATEPARVPLLALYQLVSVNYGAFASPEDAEAFGAAALGMTRDEYYETLCALADEIAADPEPAADGGGCHCGEPQD